MMRMVWIIYILCVVLLVNVFSYVLEGILVRGNKLLFRLLFYLVIYFVNIIFYLYFFLLFILKLMCLCFEYEVFFECSEYYLGSFV